MRPATASAQRSGPDAREAAREHIARGWAVIDVPPRGKAPTRRDWQHARLTADEVDPAGNVGVLLGEPSGGLLDVDLDTPEAIAAAPYLLPTTDMRHGRESKRASHWWYICADPGGTVRYRDPDGPTLVEIRSTGCQTIVPPSVHPSGETLTWESSGDPARVDADTLRRAVARVAACAMVARRWPQGSRHDAALALAGVLCRGAMPQADAARLVEVVARTAGDPESGDRIRTVWGTYAATGPTTGGPRLADLLSNGAAVVDRLRRWLDLRAVEDTVDRPLIRVVTVAELLALDLPAREMVLAPWLPVQGLAMLYGPRGVGKTWLLLAIAYAIAAGDELLAWRAPQPRRVLYVDGEMPAPVMRERLARLIRGVSIEAAPEMLRIVTPDLQAGAMPDLSTVSGRAALEPHVREVDAVIVDSISTLTSAAESEADEWLPLQRWGLDLRRAGKSVLLGHHAGKGGQQRGTSRREDVLDTVLALRRPVDYRAEDGARAEVVVDKGRGIHGDDARTIEIALADDGGGGLRWTYRTQDQALTERVAAMIRDKLTHRQIASELHCGVSTVSRHRRAAITAGLLTEDHDE